MSLAKRPGEYNPDDPMWVVGCIDSYGAITARIVSHGGSVTHTAEESRGRRWRWNIWGQDFVATRNPAHDRLSDNERVSVMDWLVRHGCVLKCDCDICQCYGEGACDMDDPNFNLQEI